MRALLVLILITASCKPEAEVKPPPISAPAAEAALEKAFRTVGPFVKPIRTPEPGDWLSEREEEGQTFEQWQDYEPNIPSPERRVIYLQPVGPFSGPRTVDLLQLQRFATTFFQLPVVVRDTMPIDRFPTREHFGGLQIKAGDVLDALREDVPTDAYCVIAVTMTDLYPRPSWNFVFGMASLRDRVGVFSFARYSPQADELTESQRLKMTERAFKVLSHETGHMFGIHHCTAHHCGMNGSNHLQETDGSPLHFCPVCLRKLQSAVGFNVAERDAKLSGMLDDAGLWRHARWYSDRREWLLEP